jgi:cell division septation protein DedD
MYSTLDREDPLYARGPRQQPEPPPPESNDLTLGMPALLGIFFAIVIICGLAFGYGYSVGHHPRPVTSAPVAAEAPSAAIAAPPLESATQPVGTAPETTSGPEVSGTPKPSPASGPEAQMAPAPLQQDASPAAMNAPVHADPAPQAAAAGVFMVQIAAVVHAQDAEALAAALRHDGYKAQVRTEPQDHFLHVQVGPFATRDAARAMRARLQANGYSPILKP